MKFISVSIFCIIALVSCKKETKNTSENTIKKDSVSLKKSEDTLVNILQTPTPPIVELEELNDSNLNKITIPLSRQDSSLLLTSDMHADHRIFGYAKPDVTSEKLILFSVFTSEVEKNPSRCKFGSYYEIQGNSDKFSLKFKAKKKDFVHVILTDSVKQKHDVYFEKEWVEFD